MGGKGSAPVIKHPDVSDYEWDGKEEPVLPPSLLFLDSLEITLQSIRRCEELGSGFVSNGTFAEIKLDLMRYISYMKAIISKERKEMYRKTASTVYERSKKAACKRSIAAAGLQNEDDTTHPGWDKAYSEPVRNQVASRIQNPSLRDIRRENGGGI